MTIHSNIQETSSSPIETSSSDSSGLSNVRKSLIDIFQQIFSADQMDIYHKQNLLSKSEQEEAQRMARQLIDQEQLPSTSEEFKKLTEWVIMLRDRYSDRLERQSIRTYKNDRERIERLDQIQKLSELLEIYGQAHDDLTDLLPALKKLRNEWKTRKKDVERILMSILSSNTLEKARVVKPNRLNSLNLGIKSFGKSYLLFERGMTQESERRETINQVATDFSIVFEENASQNLTRMSSSYHRVFQRETDNVINEIQALTQQVYIERPSSLQMPPAPVLEKTIITTNTEASPPVQQQQSTSTGQERRDSVLVERRQSTTNASNNDNDGELTFPFDVTKPVFEPLDSDWPYILKYKLPAHTVSYWCNRMPFQHKQENREEGIWSVSIPRLSKYFTKIGHEYYSNMFNNAKLIHTHQAQLFDFASKSLISCYAAIQLEQGCSNLSRVLVYLYRLEQEPINT